MHGGIRMYLGGRCMSWKLMRAVYRKKEVHVPGKYIYISIYICIHVCVCVCAPGHEYDAWAV